MTLPERQAKLGKWSERDHSDPVSQLYAQEIRKALATKLPDSRHDRIAHGGYYGRKAERSRIYHETKECSSLAKYKSFNQLNKEIQTGQAPNGIERIDKGAQSVKAEQPHVHFKDGTALNIDGAWKHGAGTLNAAQREWLLKNGWNIK